VGPRYGMVWVDGKGYVKIAKAHAYQAIGLNVEWGTAEPEPEKTVPLQYKDTE
jgi:hypothetical protein